MFRLGKHVRDEGKSLSATPHQRRILRLFTCLSTLGCLGLGKLVIVVSVNPTGGAGLATIAAL